ncbi:MAG: hypothetical protein RIC30_04800 [Marinoscillum sp.]|uniref:hypothetical protein n=1 Tax=Marinoscillum sp. TaxID=2024838 RepID=UPI0033015347
MKKILENNQLFRTSGLLSLTLGLAPFVPEPHVWGKIQWVLGGAVGMQPMDYFDLVLHGSPWVVFIVLLTYRGVRYLRPS